MSDKSAKMGGANSSWDQMHMRLQEAVEKSCQLKGAARDIVSTLKIDDRSGKEGIPKDDNMKDTMPGDFQSRMIESLSTLECHLEDIDLSFSQINS